MSPSRRIFLAFACVILLLAMQGLATLLSVRFTLAETQRLNAAQDSAQRIFTLLNRTQSDVALITGSRNPGVMDAYQARFRKDWSELLERAEILGREDGGAPRLDPDSLARLGTSYEQTINLQYQFAFELAQQRLANTLPLYEAVSGQVSRMLDAAERQKAAALYRVSRRALAQAVGLSLLAIAVAVFWAWYLQKVFTDRKRAEATLAAALRRLQLVLDSATQVAIIMSDPRGLVQVFNRGAEILTGWPASEVVDRETPMLWHLPEEVEARSRELEAMGETASGPFAPFATLARMGGEGRRRWTWITRQGGRRTIDLAVTRVDDLDGRILGYLGVGVDVTQEVEAAAALRSKEDELRHSQKMDAIGQLAGGVAHDFNNMLAGIMSSAELLEEGLEPDDPRTKLVRLISTASQRAADLTSKLLSFSRRGKLISTAFSVHRSIQESLMLVRRSIDRRIEVRLQLMPGEPLVVGDPSEIESALLNLCINARDAMPEGGILTVGTEARERDGVPMVCIQVADTGVGIPDAIRQRIFEPFFTTKAQGKGTGLGLAAVYGIVTAHHGLVELDSAPGRGTTVRMLLPLAARDARPASEDARPSPRGHGTVLVIDDEEVVRTTASMILGKAGYDVILAENGMEGIRLHQEHAGTIALVLLDLIMPGISGKETAQRIGALDPQARILFTSGFASEGVVTGLQASGATGFLHKPYTAAALLDAAAALLAAPTGGRD